MSRRQPDLHAIRASVAAVGQFSDGLLKIGPLRLGADAALSWIPIVGEFYSGAAAVFLLVQGARARTPLSTLIAAGGLMGGRTLITAIPFAGPVAADVLALHGVAARMIVKAIDRRIEATGARSTRSGFWRPAISPA